MRYNAECLAVSVLVSQGRRHSATLLPEGTIQWNGQIFASPYAWASHCKNLINPHQKTAIGWGHVSYSTDTLTN